MPSPSLHRTSQLSMMTIIRVRIGREARPGPHVGKPYSDPLASTRRLAISYSAVQGYWSRSRHPGPAPPFRSGVRTRMSAAATTYRNASDAPSLSRASESNAARARGRATHVTIPVDTQASWLSLALRLTRCCFIQDDSSDSESATRARIRPAPGHGAAIRVVAAGTGTDELRFSLGVVTSVNRGSSLSHDGRFRPTRRATVPSST